MPLPTADLPVHFRGYGLAMSDMYAADAFARVMGERRGRPAASALSRTDRHVIAAFLAGRMADGDAV